jgi:hypothetical protein
MLHYSPQCQQEDKNSLCTFKEMICVLIVFLSLISFFLIVIFISSDRMKFRTSCVLSKCSPLSYTLSLLQQHYMISFHIKVCPHPVKKKKKEKKLLPKI